MSDYVLGRVREKLPERESEPVEGRERLPANPFRRPADRPETQRLFRREVAASSP